MREGSQRQRPLPSLEEPSLPADIRHSEVLPTAIENRVVEPPEETTRPDASSKSESDQRGSRDRGTPATSTYLPHHSSTRPRH